jgi:hypothetical protein
MVLRALPRPALLCCAALSISACCCIYGMIHTSWRSAMMMTMVMGSSTPWQITLIHCRYNQSP